MKSAKAVAAVIGLFVLGITVGGAGMHLYYAERIAPPPPHGRGGLPWLSERLFDQLELEPGQEERARRVLEDTRREAETLRHEIRPQFEEVMERGIERLEEILTPEQKATYEELRRRHRERVESFLRGPRRSRRGPHSGRERRPPASSERQPRDRLAPEH